jgi:hypothetical protein
MKYRTRNHAYLDESTEHVVGRDGVRRVTQCVSGLVCEPSKLRRLHNSSHNYERQHRKNPYILEIQKNTYHVVLKRATLRFHGAAACHFIVDISKLIVVIGVLFRLCPGAAVSQPASGERGEEEHYSLSSNP